MGGEMITDTFTSDAGHGAEPLDVYDVFATAGARFVATLDRCTEAQWNTPAPPADWTVRDTAAHVASVMRRITLADGRRATDPGELVRLNDACIHELDGVDPTDLVAEIDAAVALVAERGRSIPADQRFAFHFGHDVTARQGVAVATGELIVHGHDIARALDRSFAIEPTEVAAFWPATMAAAASSYLIHDDRPEERWRVRFAELDASVTLVIDDDSVTVAAPGESADRLVEVDDAVAFMLGFPFRRGPVVPAAAVELASRFRDEV